VGRLEALAGATGTIATGEINLGVLGYIAPEQAEGKAPDVRSDVYSAGAIFHEMLTGRAPGAKFGLPSQLNTELPSDVDVLVLKCLARSSAERYGTVVHLLGDVERLEETLRLRLLGELQGISRSTSRLLGKSGEGSAAAAEGGGKKGSPMVWVGVGVTVLVAVLIVWFFMLR
jgi:serine/threonine-protein kinase